MLKKVFFDKEQHKVHFFYGLPLPEADHLDEYIVDEFTLESVLGFMVNTASFVEKRIVDAKGRIED
ncbi:MAG: hypothetical protein AB1325_13465 [Nitrospirota bacterium]